MNLDPRVAWLEEQVGLGEDGGSRITAWTPDGPLRCGTDGPPCTTVLDWSEWCNKCLATIPIHYTDERNGA